MMNTRAHTHTQKGDLWNQSTIILTLQVAVSGERYGDGRTSSPCENSIVLAHHLSHHHHFLSGNPFSVSGTLH